MATDQPLNQRFVLWLSLAQLITWGSVFYTFALLMEPIEHELGLTRAQSSVAFSLALLVEGLCAYPVGRLIDGGRERAVMTLGTLLVGCCLLLHSLIDSRWQFYLVWATLGAGMGAPILNLRAQSEVKLKTAPADLVKLDLTKSLVHSWVESPDFKLYFYSEREGDKPHGYVEIVITAKYAGDEGDA